MKSFMLVYLFLFCVRLLSFLHHVHCCLLFSFSISGFKVLKCFLSDHNVLRNTGNNFRNTFKSCPTGHKSRQERNQAVSHSCSNASGKKPPTALLLPLLENITWSVFLVSSLHLRHSEEAATLPLQARTSLSNTGKVRAWLNIIILYLFQQTLQSLALLK